jgi:hypothetical protein
MNMKNWLLTVFAFVSLGVTTPSARADWHDWPPSAIILNWPGYSVYPPGTVFRKEIVNGTYPHWYPQQVPTVVPRVTYKDEVIKVKTWVNLPKVFVEKQSALTYVPVQRLVEQEVTTYVTLPMFLTDPNGKPVLACRAEIKTHKVSYPVQDYTPVMKQYAVNVTKMVPTEKVVEYKQRVPVVVYDQQLTTQWQVVMVPYQKIVTVPTFNPNNAPSLFWP